MRRTVDEDGLTVVEGDTTADADDAAEAIEAEDGYADELGIDDGDLESLVDAFVDAFNDRDLDTLLSLVDADVDVPDVPGGDDGADVLADEVCSVWERSPAAILTRAHWAGRSCALAWLPDEDGSWVRAGVWMFDTAEGLLSMVACPDDPDALQQAAAEDPAGEELEEWRDWGEWDSGVETLPVIRG